MKNSTVSQKDAAESLVRRARVGDQNALAIIVKTGENARAGVAKAKSAYGYILDYIKNHPTPSPMGAEDVQNLGILKAAGYNPPGAVVQTLCNLPNSGNSNILTSAIVALANACPWGRERIGVYDSIFAGDPQAHKIWRFGYTFSSSPELAKVKIDKSAAGILCAGHCIGTARKIQLARLPNIPMNVLGKQIGWELGL
jgi:hypothetical protein